MIVATLIGAVVIFIENLIKTFKISDVDFVVFRTAFDGNFADFANSKDLVELNCILISMILKQQK